MLYYKIKVPHAGPGSHLNQLHSLIEDREMQLKALKASEWTFEFRLFCYAYNLLFFYCLFYPNLQTYAAIVTHGVASYSFFIRVPEFILSFAQSSSITVQCPNRPAEVTNAALRTSTLTGFPPANAANCVSFERTTEPEVLQPGLNPV